MKKGLAIPVSLILLTSLVSAFDTRDIIESIDPLIVVFMVAFAIFFFGASKVFKNKVTGQENKAVATIVALGLAFFIVYFLHQSSFELEDIFYDLGFNADTIETLVIILVLVGIGYMLWKIKLKTIAVLGVIFLLLSLTNLAYDSESALYIGLGLIVLYFILKFIFREKTASWATGNLAPAATAVGRGAWGATKWGGKQLGKGGATLGNKALAKAGVANAQIRDQQRQIEKQRKQVQAQLIKQYNNLIQQENEIMRRNNGIPKTKREITRLNKVTASKHQLEQYAQQYGLRLR